MTDIGHDMPKAYEHQEVEAALYEWWERNGFFSPDTQAALGQSRPDAEPFVVSMPPPNVTGALHLGHAITNSVEDLLIRYNRMLGRPTLWVPGTDHAGIATQNVVERELERQGTSRHELGRVSFVREVWDWKDEYHTRITLQQKRMGISCDWDRERFTLDDGLSEAVLQTFIQLYNEGLIYRANYLVNWCPRCTSAISDLEVEYEEENGRFYTFKYPLSGGGFLHVSTTRPETILGDTAVAVHPDDDRYRDCHRQGRSRPNSGSEDTRDCRRLCRPRVRHWRTEGDAGTRSERLRDRQAARSTRDQHHEPGRNAE